MEDGGFDPHPDWVDFFLHSFGGQRRDSSLELGACNGQATARLQASSQECVI